MEKNILTPEEIRGLLAWETEGPGIPEQFLPGGIRKKRQVGPENKVVDFFQDVLNALGEAIIITDRTGKILFQNAFSMALLGQSLGAIRRKRFEKAVRLLDRAGKKAIENPVQRCLREASLSSLPPDTLLQRVDGSTLSVRGSASPIFNGKGLMEGVVVSFHMSRPVGLTRDTAASSSIRKPSRTGRSAG